MKGDMSEEGLQSGGPVWEEWNFGERKIPIVGRPQFRGEL